ncbi:MAG TPA: hypothetical protein VM537_34870 [Anaerolineae bacterium]|nr:hypothetical protein [Anaerolineae bacterium]
MTQTLFVDKFKGTFADPLLAYGLAVVVGDVLARTDGRGQPSVHLSDHGGYYRLDCTPALDDARLATVQTPYVPAVAIRTAKNAAKLPSDLPPQAVVDYEAERDKRAAFFEIRKSLPKEALVAQARGEHHPALAALHGQEPHPDWDVFRAVNPPALIGYNKLMTCWWTVQEALPEVLTLLRDLFFQTPNDLAKAITVWGEMDKAHGWGIKAGTTAAQIFNPSQGKGQNRAKADKLQMDNIKDAFWLVEWLKAVGFYHAALTKQLRGVKDRKTYVLAPAQIDLGDSSHIMHAFRGRMARAETAIRSDVLASIRYTQAMLEFTRQREGASLKARLFKHRQPSRVVSGFYSAFYKDLGNAVATMNLSFIGLPGWIRVEEEGDVGDALDVLAEHERIVRQFDESHSDDYDMLLLYRDFLSGNDLRPFFEFTTAYSGYIVSQRERPGGRARQFTTTNLRRLIMNSQEGPRLSKILETPGFQNIAYAIRQATVTAQYRKQQKDRRYDVRYGLGQQLARKAAYPQEFVAELADFLAKYNAENAQVMEKRPGPYRRGVRTSDIDDIVALIDEFGDSRLICNLLVAYGYARVPRAEEDQEPADEDNE